jgi:putative hydrolase of the HAD superfamily
MPVLIFDGDNTLWDTDAVFRSAQFGLLTTLGDAGIVHDPHTQLDLLRALDRELISQLGVAEYDFRLLAVAVARFFTGQLTIATAVAHALVPPEADGALDAVIDAALDAFRSKLSEVPPLFPGAEIVLTSIRSAITGGAPAASVLYSEGKAERIEHILESHGLQRRGFFDVVVLAPKTVEGFRHAEELGRAYVRHTETQRGAVVVVGDSLQRDIRPANQIGATTVYKPSKFKGNEVPQSASDAPAYTIGELTELLNILVDFGFPGATSEPVPISMAK